MNDQVSDTGSCESPVYNYNNYIFGHFFPSFIIWILRDWLNIGKHTNITTVFKTTQMIEMLSLNFKLH